uniref:60S acidic ribosomal protein P2-1 n=1 Tax=Stygiella incarcerata TaxID=1712417 RepID=A0A192ZI25_9EUKA|nr:60S acidic ribosomal protein P2-1 [Stygiella incarcerata]|eukprot:TRINITY_DN50_c2_g1_i1.p2 TRINITY_DN50_c2_g1~~TRINITY_DN50_c2_g1_i1.p2  ORF type:complete len:111 (-),score=51.56 TRINITY_DN50_c2_g1_i1:237-569(-)
MKHIAAYLLAVLGGNMHPAKGDIEKILSSVGVDAEEEMLDKLMSELQGKSLEEVIEAGRSKMSSVPMGGAVAASGAAVAASTEEKPEEEAKVEEEEEEESDDDMGFGLFD